MIKNIAITNLLLFQNISLTLHKGLNVITGETGTGKSILLRTIGWLTGEKGNVNLINDKIIPTTIEANIHLSDIYDIPQNMKEWLSPTERDIILRYEMKPTRSRHFFDHQLIPTKTLKTWAETYIEKHNQHAQYRMSNPLYQRLLIDNPHLTELKKRYEQDYHQMQDINERIVTIEKKLADIKHSSELHDFQLKELSIIPDDPNALSTLKKEINALEAKEDYAESINTLNDILSHDNNNLIHILQELITNTKKLSPVDDSYLSIAKELETAIPPIKELSQMLANHTDLFTNTSEKLENLRNQELQIQRVLKKYDMNMTELLKYKLSIQESDKQTEMLTIESEKLQNQWLKLSKEVLNKAHKLHKERIKQAKIREKQIEEILHNLNMPNAQFSIQIKAKNENPKPEDLSPHGYDSIQFLLKSIDNKPFMPIEKVASGGELSRIMLAISSTCNQNMLPLVMVFDEIDSGVSGEAAFKIGELLKKIAKNSQVITITHLPQIASVADTHYFVEKHIHSGNTYSTVTALNKQERINEIARLISSEKITQEARQHAKKMLNTHVYK